MKISRMTMETFIVLKKGELAIQNQRVMHHAIRHDCIESAAFSLALYDWHTIHSWNSKADKHVKKLIYLSTTSCHNWLPSFNRRLARVQISDWMTSRMCEHFWDLLGSVCGGNFVIFFLKFVIRFISQNEFQGVLTKCISFLRPLPPSYHMSKLRRK